MNIHYLRNRRSVLDLSRDDLTWDIFVSAYNDSDRVQTVFEKISGAAKLWAMLPEYGYRDDEVKTSDAYVHFAQPASEAEVVDGIARAAGIAPGCGRICIDMTGFMRPHILFLVRYLHDIGVQEFDMIYTEPAHYSRKEHTSFSGEEVDVVRQVIGFEGAHVDDMTNDALIIGVGYDDALVSRVVNDKVSAKLIQLLSLPSLSADMYQESILRLDKTGSSFNPDFDERVFFAPANDPFVVASELSSKYVELLARRDVTNLYLCPLATKPQTLGFCLFYLHELQGEAASILFPFSREYARETSKGIGRTWLYEVRL